MKTSLKISTILLLCIALFQSCHKDKTVAPEVVPININCTEFTNAVVANDLDKIKTLVDAFFASRKPVYDPIRTDDEGYGTHLALLVSQINACSGGIVAYSCYMCYQTAPTTTIMELEQSNNSQAKKIRIWILSHHVSEHDYKPTGIAYVVNVVNF